MSYTLNNQIEQINIDSVTHQVRLGNVYSCSYIWADVAVDGYALLLIKTSTRKIFLDIGATAELKAYFGVRANYVLTGDGTAVTVRNRNKDTTNVTTVSAFRDPPYSNLGDSPVPRLIGASGGGARLGGNLSDSLIVRIAANSEYFVALQNKATTTKDLCLFANWIEIDRFADLWSMV